MSDRISATRSPSDQKESIDNAEAVRLTSHAGRNQIYRASPAVAKPYDLAKETASR